jgi:hypothetical protein
MFRLPLIPNIMGPKMNEMIVLGKIARWEKVKALVLDSVSSPITKRVYNMALNEFMAWFQQAPRPGFTKATVSAWRVSLEERRLGSSSIIIRMSAIRKLAAEAADRGIRVNAVSPGVIPTPGYHTSLGMSEQQQNDYIQSVTPAIPLGRTGTPDEIAKAVAFLASDESSYITGSGLFVDGGLGQI